MLKWLESTCALVSLLPILARKLIMKNVDHYGGYFRVDESYVIVGSDISFASFIENIHEMHAQENRKRKERNDKETDKFLLEFSIHFDWQTVVFKHYSSSVFSQICFGYFREKRFFTVCTPNQ